MDVLSDVIDVARVSGVMTGTVRARHPWGLDIPASYGPALHAVTAGACWLRQPGAEPVALMPGDVVLLARGSRHQLCSTPDGAATPLDVAVSGRQSASGDGELAIGGDGPASRFLCAAYTYDRELRHPLLSALPPVLHLAAADASPSSAVSASLRLMASEIGVASPGTRAVVTRMIDVLFVQVLRGWLADSPATSGLAPSWGSALTDPHVGAALALLHAEPGREWTVDGLAGAVHISRATLNRRFADLVGRPPMAYLTEWRMELAARALRRDKAAVGTVARAAGYRSEFAFSRAFSRHHGMPPSRYRR